MSQIQVLVPPIVAMMGLAFVLSTAMRHLRATRYEQLAFGILFGCVVIISMTNPMQMGEGLIFDTRTLLTGAAVTFIGPLAGLIAMAFGIICRIYIGGTGMITGVVGLLVAFGLAYFWTCKLGCHVRNPILHDALLGAFVTLSANALFLLPAEIALAVLAKVTVPLLICNVFGMIAIGYVLRRERAYLSERHLMQTHASTDALTTLLNRRGMDSAVTKMTFNQENGHALLYFDIDNFKVINDTYGHMQVTRRWQLWLHVSKSSCETRRFLRATAEMSFRYIFRIWKQAI
jgi:diguanylate cyclase